MFSFNWSGEVIIILIACFLFVIYNLAYYYIWSTDNQAPEYIGFVRPLIQGYSIAKGRERLE